MRTTAHPEEGQIAIHTLLLMEAILLAYARLQEHAVRFIFRFDNDSGLALGAILQLEIA